MEDIDAGVTRTGEALSQMLAVHLGLLRLRASANRIPGATGGATVAQPGSRLDEPDEIVLGSPLVALRDGSEVGSPVVSSRTSEYPGYEGSDSEPQSGATR